MSGRRATIVAFYGIGRLDGLITALQAELVAALGPEFRPRPRPTVHATVIGLELRIAESTSIRGVARHLREALRQEPLCLRFGGFDGSAAHPGFDDKGTLFERTLYVRNGNVVLSGWPVDPADHDRPNNRLAELRKDCERYGFVHKYHDPTRPDLLDPNAYLVVGRLRPVVTRPLSDLTRSGVLARPTTVPLTSDDLSIVDFESSELPLATSSARPLSAAG